MRHNDSPRWCDECQRYGDHHTDRCPEACVNCGHNSPHAQQNDDECWCGCADLRTLLTTTDKRGSHA